MIDHETLTLAVAMMSPEAKRQARKEADQRGIAIEGVLRERCLQTLNTQQAQLYALRKTNKRTALRVVKGGRA